MKGKILGCLISAKRIEANPDKIRAIREMEEPKTKKDIQKLNGRVAALNKFISRSAERSLPFFKALKGMGTIEWGPKQSKAFVELKEYIEKMAILSPPSPSEPLLLYVAASKAAVSAALVREVEAEKESFNVPSILSLKPCQAPSCFILSWRNRLRGDYGHAKAQALFRGTQGHRAHGSTLK
jgi:hypothetical protein